MTFTQAQRAVVVDASVAIQYLIGEGAWVDRWQAWVEAGDMRLAPAHFPIEVANALLRGGVRAPASRARTFMRELYATGFEIADRGLAGLERAIDLADRHGLSVYDATYLDLAIDVDAELATLDGALRAAADVEGVPLLG